jgi:asparagine synthase (glutamine-hydrolysing)
LELQNSIIQDWVSHHELNIADDALKTDLMNYLPGDLLVKTDRATMANSLEIRAPFLDVDFASFCVSLPIKYKINFPYNKKILKETYSKYLPNSIISRKKQGFGAPIKEWFKSGMLTDLVNEYTKNSQRKIFTDFGFNFNSTQNMMNEMNQKSWSLLILSIWAESKSYNI